MIEIKRAAALAAALLTPALAAAAGGTAKGTFTVQGKASKLAYAYASAKPDSQDKTREQIQVILSDVPLEAAVLDDPTPFGLQDLTRAGKLHGIRFLISPDKAVSSTSMYDAAFKMGSVSVVGSDIKLDVQTLDKTKVAGKLYTAKPGDFNGVPYEYNVTFEAPIKR
jgi:hypothetical protein